MFPRRTLVGMLACVILALPFVIAVPNPLACGSAGRGAADPNGPHNYDGTDLFSPGASNPEPFVYDQCLTKYLPHGAHDEWAAGLGGAAFMSADNVVGGNAPANDLVNGVNTDSYTTVDPVNVGGVNNCFGWPFTTHHGSYQFINTADKIHFGFIDVWIAADRHDDSGEQQYDAILNANGGVWPAGVNDPRDHCGDNVIDSTDFIAFSPACFGCAVNKFNAGGPLASIAGLDGIVWTFVSSGGTSGTTWTS